MTGLLTALFITALATGCFTLIFFICKTVDDIGIDRAEKKKIKEQRIKNVLMAFGDLDVTFEQFIAMYNIRPEQFLILNYKVGRITDLGERYTLNFRTEYDAKKFLIWKERKEEYEAQRREQEARYRNSVLVKNLLEADIEYAKTQARDCNYRAKEIINQIKENVKEEERRQND